jgi:hypothetical protein
MIDYIKELIGVLYGYARPEEEDPSGGLSRSWAACSGVE